MSNQSKAEYERDIAEAQARAERLAQQGNYEEAYYAEELVTEMGKLAAERITLDAKQEHQEATNRGHRP